MQTRANRTALSEPAADPALSGLDMLVLGTVNAPYKYSISATELAGQLAHGCSDEWLVHVTAFLTNVRPELVLKFGQAHGIGPLAISSLYQTMKDRTGQRSAGLEAALVALAPAT